MRTLLAAADVAQVRYQPIGNVYGGGCAALRKSHRRLDSRHGLAKRALSRLVALFPPATHAPPRRTSQRACHIDALSGCAPARDSGWSDAASAVIVSESVLPDREVAPTMGHSTARSSRMPVASAAPRPVGFGSVSAITMPSGRAAIARVVNAEPCAIPDLEVIEPLVPK